MTKRLLVGFLCVVLSLPIGVACAVEDYRAMMLAAEATPLDFFSLSQRVESLPIACAPDDFVRMLKGEQGDAMLAGIWAGLSFMRSSAGGEMEVVLPGGGYIVFSCTDDHIWRSSHPDIRLLGKAYDVEVVCFGTPDYYDYAFIFMRGESEWELVDCLFAFERPEIHANSEAAWLVGHGTQDSSQEGQRYEQWYNLLTRQVDVSFVTSANKTANMDGPDRYDTRTLSRNEFFQYTYQNDAGQHVVDCALKVVKYTCLEQYHNFYSGENTSIEQKDALAQVDVYLYDQETHSLEKAGSWQYENASPAFLENTDYRPFLDGGVVSLFLR